MAWPETEKYLLVVLLDVEKYRPEIFTSVRREYFSAAAHRTLFALMADLYEQRGVFDIEGVCNELVKRQLTGVISIASVNSLTERLVRHCDVPKHAAVLRDAWAKRLLVTELEAVQELAESSDCADLRRRLEAALALTEGGIEADKVKPLASIVKGEFDALTRERKTENRLLGIPTGIANLDTALTGLRGGEYTVIGGYPGDGKTTLLMQMAREAAKTGHPALVLSLEMRSGELARRLIAVETRTAFAKLRDPRMMNATEWQTATDALEPLSNLPLHICDESSLDASTISALAKLWIKKAGVKAVFVDFLQIVKTGNQERRLAIGAISAALRELAKTTGAAVVTSSQLSRPRDGSVNARPTLFSLRESGEIEQDAHNVLLLYRPVDDQRRRTGEDEIVIAKQRHGVTGSVPVTYNSKLLTFEPRCENV
jgi:replicative DNA helicase